MDEALFRRCLARDIVAREGGPAAAWIARLPADLDAVVERWSLRAPRPLRDDGHGGRCSWVAGCERADGTPAVLKVGFPHTEGRDEIDGLAFWDGNPTVRLLAADRARDALLLERCEPGEALSRLPEEEQDEVIGSLLRRLHRAPPDPHPFRSLADLVELWVDGAPEAAGPTGGTFGEVAGRAVADRGDAEGAGGGRGSVAARGSLFARGVAELERLAETAPADVLLATDLHAGNVLGSAREPWLAIDPKPYVGDPAYDVTQHCLNCPARLYTDPAALVERVAARAGVDPVRARRWLFVRLAVEFGPGDARARATACMIDPARQSRSRPPRRSPAR